MPNRTVRITRAGEGVFHQHPGGAGSRSPVTEADNAGVAVQWATMPVGSGPPFHRHPSFDEVFIILEGAVEFQVGDEVHTARAGDTVFVPGEVPHAPRSVAGNAQGEARIIMLITPARFETFFHELADLLASGRGDHASIAALGAGYGIEFLERPPVRTRHEPA
jgi:quercetin dioxygenase-like cupin family protein